MNGALFVGFKSCIINVLDCTADANGAAVVEKLTASDAFGA